MARYERKQGDTAVIAETITEPNSSDPLDVSTASSVTMYMDHPESETVVIHDDVSFVTDGSDGQVEKSVPASATSREGRYRIEFLVVYPDGRRISHPSSGFIALSVSETTGRELPDPVIQIVTDTSPDPVAVKHVQTQSDLTDEGWYFIDDQSELVYFDGDASTN